MSARFFVIAILALPSLAPAQKKEEMRELQRDVSQTLIEVSTLKKSFDEQMATLSQSVRSNADATRDLQKAVAGLETHMNDKFAESARNTSTPVATMGTKFDQMSADFARMVESMNDLLSRMSKLEQRVVTLDNTLKSTMPAPPPPGSPATGTLPAGGSGAPAIPADTLYENARRDMMGGKADLALQGFQEYVRAYGSTDKAPNAEYWIGQIHYDRGDFEKAVQAFDNVLSNYDENNKTADAMLMKGRCLLKLGRKNEAVTAFRKLYADYPKSEAGPKGCTELKSLGFNCTTGASKKRRG
jgi:tol-pal system protein YbgF